MSSSTAPKLPAPEPLAKEEYARRRTFLDSLRRLGVPEMLEIVRMLRQHGVEFTENNNGVFFNVAALPQAVFDDLERFIAFSASNAATLEARTSLLTTLQTPQTTPTMKGSPAAEASASAAAP